MLTRLLALVAPPLCTACGGNAGRAAPLCRDCRAAMGTGGFVAGAPADLPTWTSFPYEGPAGALVRSLKFGARLPVADVMAAQLAAGVPADFLAGVVVPVPLHPARLRRRGFNHSRVLAEALARRAGLDFSDCLERVGDRRPQVGRGRRERLAAMEGRMVMRAGAAAPARALLVDDVVTTGATLAACAGALRGAGTRDIGALAYARTRGR